MPISQGQRNALMQALNDGTLSDPADMQSAAAKIKEHDAGLASSVSSVDAPTAAAEAQLAQGQVIPDVVQNVGRGIKEKAINLFDVGARPFRSGEKVDAARLAEVTRLRETERLQADQARANLGQGQEGFAAAFEGGKLAPELVGGLSIGAVRGIGGRVAAETALGGLSGAARDPNAGAMTLLLNTGIGASTSFGIGSLAEVPGITQNVILGRLSKNADARYGKGAYDDLSNPFHLRKDAERAQIDLTLGEQLEDPALLAMEARVVSRVGGPRETFMNKRVDDALRSWDSLVTQLNPEKVGTGTAIKTMRESYAKRVKDIQEVAGNRFRATLRPVIDAIPGASMVDGNIVGGPALIQVDNYAQYLRIHKKMLVEKGEKVPASLNKEIADLAKNNNRVTLGSMQSRFDSLGNELSGKELPIQAADRAGLRQDARQSMNNLIKDLERTSNNPALDGATAKALRKARDGYANDMIAMDELRNSAVDNVLGKVGPTSGRKFTDNFLALEPSEQREVFRFLDQYAPDQASIVRGQMWHEIQGQATTSTPLSNTQRRTGIDFQKMSQTLAERDVESLAAIWGVKPESVGTIRDALDVLSSIGRGGTSSPAAGAVRGAINRAETAAINLASRNEGFVARLLAGEMTPGAVERWLYTPEGVRALLQIGNRNAPRTAVTQAMQTLMTMELTSQQEIEGLEAEIAQAEQEERTQQSVDVASGVLR